MSISFSGLASGLPVNDIIQQLMALERRPLELLEQKKSTLQTQKTYIDNVESKVRNFKNAVQTLTDGNLISSMDLFKKKQAKSSDESIATVTASANAVNQSFELNVISTATATKVESNGTGAANGNVASLLTGSTLATDLANETGTAGKFKVYYNNEEYEIDVLDTDNVDNVMTKISNIGGGGLITASLAAGKITLASTGGGTINVGSSSDTSNFLNVTQLSTGTRTGNDITSKNALNAVKTSGTIMGTANLQNAAGITAGTFTIGKASFTVDNTTTLDGLINEINSKSDAGVTANYNINTNKIELISKNPGKVAINLDDNGTGVLNSLNLINGVDKLAYQTLGSNAKIKINNGAEIESTSNTVSASVSGLKDVNLTLLDDSAGSNITISINQDTTALTDAVDKVVSTYNETIKYIDDQLNAKTGGKLAGDPTLMRFRSSMRTYLTNYMTGLPLSSLADLGINTGAVGMKGDPTSQLKFDKSKFLSQLEEDPTTVKKLMIGDNASGTKGLLGNVKNFLDSALATENGFFASRDDAISSQISDIDENLLKSQDRLDQKEQMLKAQFNAMEQAISKMKSQSSYMGG